MPKPAHDPGGKVKLALKAGITGTAEFGGKNEEYRYRLTRTWDDAKPYALFVLMNPSEATPDINDPTVAKCCRFAAAWGYGGIFVANTFAYRCTDQKRLLETRTPSARTTTGTSLKWRRRPPLWCLHTANQNTSSCVRAAPTSRAS